MLLIDLVELLCLQAVLRSVLSLALLNLSHQILIIDHQIFIIEHQVLKLLVCLLLVQVLFLFQLVQLFSVNLIVCTNRGCHRLESFCECRELVLYFLVNVPCFFVDFLFVLLDFLEDL